MRTSIEIDDALLEEAFSFSKAKTKKRFDSRGSHRIRLAQKKDLIHEVLTEYVWHKKRKDLTELAGQIRFSKNYDYKSMRTLKGVTLFGT